MHHSKSYRKPILWEYGQIHYQELLRQAEEERLINLLPKKNRSWSMRYSVLAPLAFGLSLLIGAHIGQS